MLYSKSNIHLDDAVFICLRHMSNCFQLRRYTRYNRQTILHFITGTLAILTDSFLWSKLAANNKKVLRNNLSIRVHYRLFTQQQIHITHSAIILFIICALSFARRFITVEWCTNACRGVCGALQRIDLFRHVCCVVSCVVRFTVWLGKAKQKKRDKRHLKSEWEVEAERGGKVPNKEIDGERERIFSMSAPGRNVQMITSVVTIDNNTIYSIFRRHRRENAYKCWMQLPYTAKFIHRMCYIPYLFWKMLSTDGTQPSLSHCIINFFFCNIH